MYVFSKLEARNPKNKYNYVIFITKKSNIPSSCGFVIYFFQYGITTSYN